MKSIGLHLVAALGMAFLRIGFILRCFPHGGKVATSRHGFAYCQFSDCISFLGLL